MKANKLRQLENYKRGITDFAEWVDATQDRFKAHVHGPLLLEVTVKDIQHAKYLEQQVPRAWQLPLPCWLSLSLREHVIILGTAGNSQAFKSSC